MPLYGERLDRVRIGALLLSSVGLVLVVLAPLAGASGVVVDPLGVGSRAAGRPVPGDVHPHLRPWLEPMPNLHVTTFVIGMVVRPSACRWRSSRGQGSDLLLPFQQPEAWVWILAGAHHRRSHPDDCVHHRHRPDRAQPAAILMTIEPLVGVTIAALFLREQPSLIQLIGGAAVLVAAAVLQIAPRSAGQVAVEPEMGPLV